MFIKIIFKKIIQIYFKLLAKVVIHRHSPEIIVVAGSNYKHLLKLAIYEVLSKKYSVRIGPKKYNAEIGVPLTIFGLSVSSLGKRKAWIKIILKATFSTFFAKSFPQKIILEIGIDKPNDMDYFLSFLKPRVVVLTNISDEYLDNFGSLEKKKKEYKKLVQAIPEQGIAFLNYDDQRIRELKQYSNAQTYYFGIEEGSGITVKNMREKNGLIIFDVWFKENSLGEARVPYGRQNIYSILIKKAIEKFY